LSLPHARFMTVASDCAELSLAAWQEQARAAPLLQSKCLFRRGRSGR
jgi:hypothetical protein